MCPEFNYKHLQVWYQLQSKREDGPGESSNISTGIWRSFHSRRRSPVPESTECWTNRILWRPGISCCMWPGLRQFDVLVLLHGFTANCHGQFLRGVPVFHWHRGILIYYLSPPPQCHLWPPVANCCYITPLCSKYSTLTWLCVRVTCPLSWGLSINVFTKSCLVF